MAIPNYNKWREVFIVRNRLSNTLWGFIFILVGVGIAGNIMNLWTFELFFPGWWTLFIIVPCLLSMVRSGISVGAGTGFVVGVLLLISQYVALDINIWRLIVPAILIIIGLRIMFQGSFRRTIKPKSTVYVEGQEQFHNTNNKEYSAIFGSNNIKITDYFTRTNLNAIFGAIVLDLRDAVINSDVEISATAVFGGIDIYVPSGMRVKVNNVPIFGGISNKTVTTTEASPYTIYINSTTMFGGIDIK
jgi:predicted membrane protein